MRLRRWIALLVALATFATACSADTTAEPLVEPLGDVVSEFDGVGAVHQGSADNFPNLEVEVVEPPVILPEGLIAIAPGLSIDENTPVTGPVEIRLALPSEPDEESIPGALRLLDDGSTQLVPGLWDPNTNELIVRADTFSDWFGGWWNPLNWIEEAVDYAVDWVTGRTDPPECQNNGPFWSAPQPIEFSSVHVCHQTNLSEIGEERAEVFLRSNRRTAQLISVPDDPAYRWNGDGFAIVQQFLVEHVAGEDPASTVWLGGGEEMSLGFSRPEETANVELSSSLTLPVVLTNLLVALLGVDESEVVGLGLAVIDCVDGIAEAVDFDLAFPDRDDLADIALEVVQCVVSIVESSDFIQSQITSLFEGSGTSSAQLQNLIDRAEQTFERIGPIAKRISAVVAAAEFGVLAFDLVADSAAASRLDWRLRGIVPTNIERPTFLGEVEVTDAGPVHLLMDTSGSMGDRSPTGVVKIEAAKAAVSDFIQSLDADRAIGLRTYPAGSRNCDSGVERIAVGDVDRTDVTAEVFGLNANGDTPTAEALRAAALDLVNFSSATIVLVSDGDSTCEPPCQVAEQLVADGLDVTVLTAGIAIEPVGREELTCVANVTGGFYTDLETVDDLNEFFREVATVALSVELDFDEVVIAESAGDGRGANEITATITNVGQETLAENVVARFGFDELGPAVVSPVRSVGNIAPGDEVEVGWSYRAGRSLIDQSLGFRIFAGADNSDVEFVSTGQVGIEGATSIDDAGPLLQDRPNIAILGDSYSAGEGAGNYFQETDVAGGNLCHRSPRTYLFQTFELPEQNLLACSGGVTRDFFAPHIDNGVDSQLDQLIELQQSGPVDAVVLSIGGNDVEFSTLAIQCIIPWRNCSDEIAGGEGASEPQNIDDFIETQFVDQDFVGTLVTTYQSLNVALNRDEFVSERGEVAPIIVLGYPRIVPFTSQGCVRTYADAIERALFSFEELVAVNQFITRLNGEVESAVDEANSRGVPAYFVSTVEASFSPDHTVCNGDAYANTFETLPPELLGVFFEERLRLEFDDFIPGLRGGVTGDGLDALSRTKVELFHPNEAGYQAVTEAILRWSNSDEARQAEAQLENFSADALPDAAEQRDLGEDSQLLLPDTSNSVALNDPILISADGFGPAELVSVGVASTYRALGSRLSTLDGEVELSVVLPENLEPGGHTVSIEGFGADGEWRVVSFPIEVPEDSRLVGYLLIGLFVVSLLGYLLSRRRYRKLASDLFTEAT